VKHKVSRRKLLSAAGAGAALAASPDVLAQGKLRLTLSCWDYDRTRALMEGRIGVDGVDLTYLPLPIEETFFRMLRNHEFDASEMSLSSYVLSLFEDPQPFIAIPVFPYSPHASSGIPAFS
jgi:hypothetical protein